MSPIPPGNVEVDDDIEMIGMEHIVPRENSASTLKPYTQHTEEDSEDEDDIDEEDSRALLGPSRHGRAQKLLEPIGKRWPQIGNIVLEVCGICIYFS